MALALRLSKYLLSSPGVSRSSEMLALMTLQPKGMSSFSMASCAAQGLVAGLLYILQICIQVSAWQLLCAVASKLRADMSSGEILLLCGNT